MRMVKMEILFILGAYKPKASANGICSEKIIKQLIDEGHNVTVISNYYSSTNNSITSNETNYYVKQRMYLRLIDYADNLPPGIKKAFVYKFAYILNKIQLILSCSTWPIISKRTIKRFSETAINQCENKKFDAVIAVYTPIEALFAGKAVKQKFPDIKFYPYFLDSLSGGYGPRFFSKETIINRGLTLEKEVFSLADKAIIMKSSYSHHVKYNSEYLDKLCVLDIPMLSKVSSSESETKNRSDSKIKLLFVGSIAKKIRNPDSLIAALLKVNRSDLYCEFIGNIDCLEAFNELKKSYKSRLQISGFISHDALQNTMAQADVFINIGNSFPNMVPSKIFEYMSYGKPIISTYSIENEPSIEYLEKYPLALLLNDKNSPEHNAQEIESFLASISNKNIPFSDLREIFYLNTPEAFLREILKEE